MRQAEAFLHLCRPAFALLARMTPSAKNAKAPLIPPTLRPDEANHPRERREVKGDSPARRAAIQAARRQALAIGQSTSLVYLEETQPVRPSNFTLYHITGRSSQAFSPR